MPAVERAGAAGGSHDEAGARMAGGSSCCGGGAAGRGAGNAPAARCRTPRCRALRWRSTAGCCSRCGGRSRTRPRSGRRRSPGGSWQRRATARSTRACSWSVDVEGIPAVMAGERRIVAVFAADAEHESMSQAELAATYLTTIRDAIMSYREERSSEVTLRGFSRALAASGVLAAAVLVLWWLRRRVDRALEKHVRTRVQSVGISSFEIVRAERLWGLVRGSAARRRGPRRARAPLRLYRVRPRSLSRVPRDRQPARRLGRRPGRDDRPRRRRRHPEPHLPRRPLRRRPLRAAPAQAVLRGAWPRAGSSSGTSTRSGREPTYKIGAARRGRLRPGGRLPVHPGLRRPRPSRGCRCSSAWSSRSARRRRSPTSSPATPSPTAAPSRSATGSGSATSSAT